MNIVPINDKTKIAEFKWVLKVNHKLTVRLDLPDGKWWEYELSHRQFIGIFFQYIKAWFDYKLKRGSYEK